MSGYLDELDGLRELAKAIVERLDLHTPMLEDIHAACCEDPDEEAPPSPLVEELREMRASIDRQTRALDALTAALATQPKWPKWELASTATPQAKIRPDEE